MASSGNVVDAQQYSEVKLWLQKAFKEIGEDVPEFQPSAAIILELHRIAKLSDQSTKYNLVLAEDANQKADEYHQETLRLQEILENVGITKQHLSQQGRENVEHLSSIANALNLCDTSTSSFMLGLADLSLKKSYIERKLVKAVTTRQALEYEYQQALASHTQLTGVLKDAKVLAEQQREQMLKWERNQLMLTEKEEQYTHQLATLQIKLERDGYDPSISHGELLRLSEQLREVQRKARPLQATLQSFQGLPPDKALAELAIEEKKAEITAAQQRLESKIGQSLPWG